MNVRELITQLIMISEQIGDVPVVDTHGNEVSSVVYDDEGGNAVVDVIVDWEDE